MKHLKAKALGSSTETGFSHSDTKRGTIRVISYGIAPDGYFHLNSICYSLICVIIVFIVIMLIILTDFFFILNLL